MTLYKTARANIIEYKQQYITDRHEQRANIISFQPSYHRNIRNYCLIVLTKLSMSRIITPNIPRVNRLVINTCCFYSSGSQLISTWKIMQVNNVLKTYLQILYHTLSPQHPTVQFFFSQNRPLHYLAFKESPNWNRVLHKRRTNWKINLHKEK